MPQAIERRRFRRATLNLPVTIRPMREEAGASGAMTMTGQAQDVSLAGVYCYVKRPCPLSIGQEVAYTVTVPVEHARGFPFTRLMGKGWVVRMDPHPPTRRSADHPGESEHIGLAVAFGAEATALSAVPQ